MSDKKEDKRLKIFCSPIRLDIFHSIIHHNQIWRPDPHDVEMIHQESRHCYERLLSRVNIPRAPDSGRILLLLGESGAGKTHLMRAFRNYTHERGLGYFVYMQMTSSVSNYARYALRYTIDSLDRPYYESTGMLTGLMHLSNALIEEQKSALQNDVQCLHNDELSREDLSHLIHKVADCIIASDRFYGLDLDLIRVLLYLQSNDPSIHARVFKYLRCEPLSEYDCKTLGGIPPRIQEDDPQRMLQALARLMMVMDSGALVICLDQMEDIQLAEAAEEKFRHAIQTMIVLAEIPNVIVLISCLHDFYKMFRNHLQQTHLDRIEQDPPPISLTDQRNAEEVQALIATRLQDLYDSEQAESDQSETIYPFPQRTPEKLAGMSARKVLDWCRQQREQSITSGCSPSADTILETDRPTPPLPPSEGRLNQLWNDHLVSSHPIPVDEHEILQLFVRSIKYCAAELNSIYHFQISQREDLLDIDIHDTTGRTAQQLTVGLCQMQAKGGALAKQINRLQSQAGARRPIAIRSVEFPSNPKTKIANQLGEFVAAGGRRIMVTDSDWRTMVAMGSFHTEYEKHPEFLYWLHNEQPLLSLPSLQQVLNIESFVSIIQADPIPDKLNSDAAQPDDQPHLTESSQQGLIRLGVTQGSQQQPYEIETFELVRHAAFLGGSGSGKTTLALNIIEQLLLQDIPVILLDRKGDLCSYAQPEAWQSPITDPVRAKMRQALHSQIEVAVYTPGSIEGQGRPLSIPIAPHDLGRLPSAQRQQLANYAAFALGEIMGYKNYGQDKSRIAILGQAISVLSELKLDQALTLDDLMDFIHRNDPLLLNAIGKLDTKLFKKLVEDLQTLHLTNGNLFAQGGELLDVQRLFGLTPDKKNSKTHLSIISTAYLGDNTNILFWVAQLLLEISRYATKSPSDQLQAVILFDEADIYLPAQSKPATKEPLENLLKRARSAGLGLMLSTQSPGDLDYKSRDQISSWFIGRVRETTALNKLGPMLSEAKMDITSKLPNQATGEFYAIRAREVSSLKAELSLVQAKQVPSDEILKLASSKTSKSVSSFFRRLFIGD